MEPDSIEELRTEIEAFAPTGQRADRQRLFTDLRSGFSRARREQVPDADPDPELWLIMQAICWGHRLYRSERAVRGAKAADWYWKERKKLEKTLARLVDHDLVRTVPPDLIESIEFYEPQEIECPHGRRRKRCERIRMDLVTLQDWRTPRYCQKVWIGFAETGPCQCPLDAPHFVRIRSHFGPGGRTPLVSHDAEPLS
jgi:hypothetical protein